MFLEIVKQLRPKKDQILSTREKEKEKRKKKKEKEKEKKTIKRKKTKKGKKGLKRIVFFSKKKLETAQKVKIFFKEMLKVIVKQLRHPKIRF